MPEPLSLRDIEAVEPERRSTGIHKILDISKFCLMGIDNKELHISVTAVAVDLPRAVVNRPRSKQSVGKQ